MKSIHLKELERHTISEAEIVRRVLSGEKELYEILLRRNNQKLFRVVRSYMKDHMEIEDIMQNTYLKAYEKLHQFNHNSLFSTWLIRIGINQSLARLKSKGRILTILTGSSGDQERKIMEIADTHQLNAEEILIRQEARQFIEYSIDKLDLKYRSVYMMREVEEMSLSEIATCLDISVANAKVRLHRARIMIKEELYGLAARPDVFEFGHEKCDRLVEYVMERIS